VTHVKVGDRVFAASVLTGGYAQYSLIAGSNAIPLPNNVSFDQGAGAWTAYATAYNSIFHIANVKKMLSKRGGKLSVMIHGASGGVGIACLQFLRSLPGLQIIGTAGTEDGKKLLFREGIHHVLNHREENYLADVAKITPEEKGIDLIFEMLADVNLDKDLKALALRGRVVIIGSRGEVQITPRDIMTKDSQVRGMHLSIATPEQLTEIKSEIHQALEDGRINVQVGQIYSMEKNVQQAHKDIINPPAGAQGKMVLHPWE
jgi:NADPH2:quinone reductase